jgi:hypothetical protein
MPDRRTVLTFRRPLSLLVLTGLMIMFSIITSIVGPGSRKDLPGGFTTPTLALQFVESPEQFAAIVNPAGGDSVSLKVARAVVADCFLILIYTLLWLGLLPMIDRSGSGFARWFPLLGYLGAGVACLADFTENMGIVYGLYLRAPADLIRIAATTKWVALGVVFIGSAAGFSKSVRRTQGSIRLAIGVLGGLYLATGLFTIAAVVSHRPWLTSAMALLGVALLLQLGLLLTAWLKPTVMGNTSEAPTDGQSEFTEKIDDVRARELEYIVRRRKTRTDTPDPAHVAGTLVGLSLSGGGIRSATTNLGILQALSRMGVLPKVDYLSTVSGGGYIGSCLSALLATRAGATPGDSTQFTYGDRQHLKFSTEWNRFPFNPDLASTSGQCGPQATPTETKDIVAHLRTHGNFLVARRGLLKHDALRAVGHLLTSTGYHLLTTATTLFVAAMLLMLLVQLFEPNLRATLGTPSTAEGIERSRVTPETGPGTAYVVTESQQVSLVQAIRDRAGLARDHFTTSIGTADARWNIVVRPAITGALTVLGVCVVFLVATRQRKWPRTWGAGENQEDKFARCLLNGAGILLLGVLLVGAFLSPRSFGSVSLLQPLAYFIGARGASFLLYVTIAKLDHPPLPPLHVWTREFRSLWGALQAMTTYGLVLAILLILLPILAYSAADESVSAWGALAPVVSLVISRLLVTDVADKASTKFHLPKGLLHFALGLAVTIVIAATVVAFAAMAVSLEFTPYETANFVLVAGAGILLMLLLSAIGDINRISPHYFYRDRLIETYLRTERPDADTRTMQSVTDASRMTLTDLQGADPVHPGDLGNTAPYMLISAAINLPGSRDLTRKDRKSGYFLFSKYFCGSKQTGYRRTDSWRGGETELSRAMTISGAAVSSVMGANTFFAEAFVLSIFNLRLGYWMSNPRTNQQDSLVVWPLFMLQEVFGTTNERWRLVNLSDGGHTGDNVGIYPLLERRCQVIIASDAEADAGLSFGSFTEALRHAYVDLGVDVDIDLSLIRPDPETGLSSSHCAVGRIRYPECPDRPNWLIYLKNSMTGDEPATVLNYKATSPVFPHESTIDQFFDDAQFESYRALGVHIAEDAMGWWASRSDVIEALGRPV